MARRSAPSFVLAVLCASSGLLAFVSPALPSDGKSTLPTVEVAVSLRASRPLSSERSGQNVALAGLLALTCLCSSAAARSNMRRSLVPRQAQEGILGSFSSLREEEEEEKKMREEATQGTFFDKDLKWDDLFDNALNEADLQEFIQQGQGTQVTAEELARKGLQQEILTLLPAPKYVRYIAEHNARRYWFKADIKSKFLAAKIAVITEHIRSMALHLRVLFRDHRTRTILVQKVAKRRNLLDELAWKDLDGYLMVRSQLKIRHTYRMEALIGRLGAYKYADKDRKITPGRKGRNRLKKTRKALETRLGKQLKAGKDRSTIASTRRKLAGRKWTMATYNEAKALIYQREMTKFVDPLNIP